MAPGAVSLRKSHDIVILPFSNIVKDQATYISLKENLILEKKKHNFAIIACHLWNFHH